MQYLSLPRFVRAKFLTFLENLLGTTKRSVNNTHRGFTFLKHPNAINFRKSSSIGIFKNSKNIKHIIKDYAYFLKDLDYEYVSNEANTLRALSSIKTKNGDVRIPKFINFIDSKNRLTVITEYINGETIGSKTGLFIKNRVIEALKFLQNSIRQISDQDLINIPVRANILTFITYPFYFVRAYVKEPSFRNLVKNNTKVFVKYFLEILIAKPEYGINHRDLSPDNILYDQKNKQTIIIDTECMVIGDKLYDLALLPRLYINYLNTKQFIEIFKSFKLNKLETKRLISLMLSATIIKIATEIKGTRDYNYATDALQLIVSKIIPSLIKQNES